MAHYFLGNETRFEELFGEHSSDAEDWITAAQTYRVDPETCRPIVQNTKSSSSPASNAQKE